MTATEKIAALTARNAILRDEAVVNARKAAAEASELLALVAEDVEAVYTNDLEEMSDV